MDNHLGSEHPAECIASDVLWLNKRGEDVIADHCVCVCSRLVCSGQAVREWRENMENGSGFEDPETEWVRVSNVVSYMLQVFANLFSL